MNALDTSPAAAAVQDEAFRSLGEYGRFKVALELSDLAHLFAVAGVQRRNPLLTPEQAAEALAVVLYGSVAKP